MAKFFGTFMQKQGTKNHYVEFEAPTMEHARAAMFAHFGDQFSTVYSEESFNPEYFPAGALLKIQVVDHGRYGMEMHNEYRMIS